MALVREKIKLKHRRARARGFTLLELIIAMAIMASVLTVASVNGVKMLERYREQIKFREVRSEIALTRYRALAERRRIVIGAETNGYLPPEGWQVTAEAPIIYMPNGACLGGALTIIAPSGRTETWALEPPECRIGNE